MWVNVKAFKKAFKFDFLMKSSAVTANKKQKEYNW